MMRWYLKRFITYRASRDGPPSEGCHTRARRAGLGRETSKIVAEGAGAVGLAALLDEHTRRRLNAEGQRIGVIVSGGNIDSGLLTRILNQEQMAVGFRHAFVGARTSPATGGIDVSWRRVSGVVPDTVEDFVAIIEVFTKASSCKDFNSPVKIVDVHHVRYKPETPPTRVEMHCHVEVATPKDAVALLERLQDAGYDFILEDSEV